MRDRRPSSISIGLPALLLAVAAWIWPRAHAAALTDPFGDCEAKFAAGPRNGQSVRCFFEVARQKGELKTAIRKLEHHLARDPENPWLHLYLAHMLLISELSPRAEALYVDAVRIFERQGDTISGVKARLDLSRCLVKFDRLEEAGTVLEEASRIAATIDDPILLARVRIRQAWQYRHMAKHLDYAYHLLRLVEEDIFPDGPDDLQKQCLDAMGAVSYSLGRSEEYLRSNVRLLAMAREAGDLTSEAEARFAIAVHKMTELPSRTARREARKLFEEALATAENADHLSLEAHAHYELGRLFAGEEGRRHLEACLGIAANLGESILDLSGKCRGALAANLVEENPRKANELIDSALAAARDSNDLWATVYGSAGRLHVRWATLPRAAAIADSLEVLDTLETLRELQDSGSGRAGLMTLLSYIYYGLSGRLLQGTEDEAGEAPGRRSADRRRDLELAFNVTERMRARVLLEALEAARAASPPPTADPLVRQLAAILERRVELNRMLLRVELSQEVRERAISELDAVDTEESEIRYRISQASPSYGALRAPRMASLDEVEQSLDENEALLSYQVGLDEDFFSGWFAGGSWLLVSTRRGTRGYRLPDRVALEPAVDVLLGRPDLDDAAAGLERLYEDLLHEALEDLPEGVERLVIIPDGKLHRLPFALLRSANDSTPVVVRYQLSVAPSATLWLRWRRLETPASDVAALALADPLLAGSRAATAATATEIAGQRQWALELGARLEPLPFARQEAETVVRTLGGKSRLLLGEEATEHFLKENDLRRYGVLHFAAHAVVNDEMPERSAIILAPGADDEDGWLQPHDIVGLELDGRVVVLASCESAAGQVLRGEGPMSLARSFFHAGAPVVVASLWPLPDDETARLFKEFYKSLAGGTSVAGALAVAQRKMLRRGAPARAWAGLVALGNGDLVPFPGGLQRPGPPAWVYAVLAVLALAAAVLVTRARGGGRRTPSSARRGGAEPSR